MKLRKLLHLLLLLLTSCIGGPDSLCAQKCAEKGADDGCFTEYTCVCLIYPDGGLDEPVECE